MIKRRGGCLCGAVRYELAGKPRMGVSCYCRDCQYVSGGAENVSMVFRRLGFAVVRGEPRVYKATPASGGSFFCVTCGVHVFSQPNSRSDLVAVKVGGLDDRTDVKVQVDIWMKSAPPWHRPYEGARRVEGNLTG